MSGPSKSKALILTVGMVATGSFNTLSNKWADLTCAKGTVDLPWHGDDKNPCVEGKHVFTHPFVQSTAMFIGEFSCLLVFYILAYRAKSQNRVSEKAEPGFNKMIMIIPALCDCTATSLMYIGLGLTYASVFQMLRGSVVIFTGIMSVLFLKRTLYAFHWVGMLLVLIGLMCVGASSLIGKSDSPGASNPLVGDILVIIAQVIVSVQMVVEEKFVSGYNVPALQAVGLEGLFGFFIICILLVIFYYVNAPSFLDDNDHKMANGDRFEDVVDALNMFSNSGVLCVAIVGNVVSIAFFNFFGISVTKEMSATTRMVLDSVRTFIIWGVSLMLGWEKIADVTSGSLQVVGFIVLLTGTCVYNKILQIPFLMRAYDKDRKQSMHAQVDEPLLNDDEDRLDVQQYNFGTNSPVYTRGLTNVASASN